MKKLFAILAAAVMVVVCASSCNKVAKSLAGTEWSYSTTVEGVVVSTTLSFDKKGSAVLTMSDGETSFSMTGTYTYVYPTVTIKVVDDEGDEQTVTATVSADYKTISFTDGPTLTRTK